ncbi:MAG: hypothetical protein AB7T63_16035 [Planctomycetota bacterium]
MSSLPTADADPAEAERLHARATALRDAPWALELRALHAVLDAARRDDATRRRALARWARRLEAEGFVSASLAVRARALTEAEPRSDAEASAHASLAHALDDEADPASRPLLEQLLERHGRSAPKVAGRALRALADDALEHDEPERARRLVDLAERYRLPLPDRMRALDALGRLVLARGDRRQAERLRAACGRLHDEALDDPDPRVGRTAARLWLDLPLALALDAHPVEDHPR